MNDAPDRDHDPANLTVDELGVAHILCDVATYRDPAVVDRVRRLVADLDAAAPDWRRLSDGALVEVLTGAVARGHAAAGDA